AGDLAGLGHGQSLLRTSLPLTVRMPVFLIFSAVNVNPVPPRPSTVYLNTRSPLSSSFRGATVKSFCPPAAATRTTSLPTSTAGTPTRSPFHAFHTADHTSASLMTPVAGATFHAFSSFFSTEPPFHC